MNFWSLESQKSGGVSTSMVLYQLMMSGGPSHVGKPIEKSIKFVKDLLSSGKKIKIFTARVANPNEEDEAREAIRAFCKKHFGKTFPITNEKDPHMVGLLDDKLDMKRVKQNTGEFID